MTGILPVALESATKILQALLLGGKEYICVMKLHGEVPQPALRSVIEEFTGEIYQKPPVRSSVKRETRTRRIYYIEPLDQEPSFQLLRIGCESGTYIRKLMHDMGQALGCGAHMAELRRTRVGPFTVDHNLVTLHMLSEAILHYREKNDETLLRSAIQPVEQAVMLLPRIYVKDSAVEALCRGAELAAPGVCKLTSTVSKDSLVAVFTLKEELICLARPLHDAVDIGDKEKGIVARTERVVMDPGTYPKAW